MAFAAVGEVRLRRGYAIIEICSVACSASPERLTNGKAAWGVSGRVHGFEGLVRVEVAGKLSNPRYPAAAAFWFSCVFD